MVPAQRIGSAKDIAKVVMFLLSEDSSYIHGENIVVDGGVMNGVLANIGRSQIRKVINVEVFWHFPQDKKVFL